MNERAYLNHIAKSKENKVTMQCFCENKMAIHEHTITDMPGVKNKAAMHEPMPIGGTGEVVLDQVLKDLTDRSTVGVEKYGEPLRTFNGRDSLMDAYQEALDLVMYLRQAIMERGTNIQQALVKLERDMIQATTLQEINVHNTTRSDKIKEE